MLKHRRQFNSTHRREGISIIEVLTSMAVATIGVFGVMVMIPFAVKQSQSGLDSDAANNLGRNAAEELEMLGLLNVRDDGNFSRLVVNAAVDGTALVPLPLQDTPPRFPLADAGPRFILPMSSDGFGDHRAPGLFHFDPIGFAAGLTNFRIRIGLNDEIEILSATTSRNTDVDLNLDGAINLTVPEDLPAGWRIFDGGTPLAAIPFIPFTDREAARLCRSNDELFYDDEVEGIDEVAPPQPLFNFDGTNRIRPQSGGRISWSAFLTPEKDPSLVSAPVTRMRANVLVYRDRFLDQTSPEALVASSYTCYVTDPDVAALGRIGTGKGYIPSISQIDLDPSVPDNAIVAGDIVRGDWVMLINRIAETDGGTIRTVGGVEHPAAGIGYRTQVGFARVTRISPDGLSVSVDGGSFDFVTSGIPDPDFAGTDPPSSPTYMVHLSNVINVYERSISTSN
jgi:hypothetical protein